MSKLFGKTDFQRMRHPAHIILTVIAMFYIGTTSFRKIALILRLTYNVKISHQTVSDWCKKFAPYWQNIGLDLVSSLDFNSDEWHADETVVKINGIKYWVWFIVDSETRFVLGYHLSPHRDAAQAFSLLSSVKDLGKPNMAVTDRLASYNLAVKAVLGVAHHRVSSFDCDIPNNLIECFNKQFKAWYKTKNGFNSFDGANNMIATFVFFFNFVRPHMALSGLTPAQVAGLSLTAKEKRLFPFVA
jgi:transposase-like protein